MLRPRVAQPGGRPAGPGAARLAAAAALAAWLTAVLAAPGLLAQDQGAPPIDLIPAEVSPADTAGPSDEEISARQAELERVRKELEERRREAANLAGQEQDVIGEIEKINQEMGLNQELLARLGQRKTLLLDDLASAQRDLDNAQASLGTASGLLGERLRGIYKFGRGQAMEVLLTAKTFADLAKRIYYLSVVADHDMELISEFERAVETKRVLVDHIEGKRERLEETEAQVAEETENLVRRKEERDALVARLKSRRSYHESLARDLQEASRQLEDLLDRLEPRREEEGYAGSGFGARMGRLSWPCEGEVISEFGVEQHPKFGTIIKNNGIDIKTASGTRVRTVGPGLVSFAGPLSGFGNCVIVDHGSGYYTLYGRLEAVQVTAGLEVAEGDALGLVGETSAPEGAVLHFEIRQGKKALDPGLWMIR